MNDICEICSVTVNGEIALFEDVIVDLDLGELCNLFLYKDCNIFSSYSKTIWLIGRNYEEADCLYNFIA